MGRYRRKKMHVNIKTQKKKYRTKRRTKDMDQIQEDMLPVNHLKLTNQKIDLDLPGAGQHYCLHCARYMMDAESLKKHFTTKPHKRRMKALKEPVYTQREADMAAGMGQFQLPVPPLVAPVKPKLKRVRKSKPSKSMDTRAPEELIMKLTGMGIDSVPVQQSKKQADHEKKEEGKGNRVNMEGIDLIFENLKVS